MNFIRYFFLNVAGKAMEAVQMYMHTHDWDAAEYVAQNHCQEGLSQVLVARASEAVEAQDFATAESLLLRAHKPEMIINHYKVLKSHLFTYYYKIFVFINVKNVIERWYVVRSNASMSRVPS